MWAQIVKARMKAESEQELAEVRELMRERIAQRPGIVSSFVMQNQHDPGEYYILTVYESEEQARAGEAELEQDPSYQRSRAIMEGTPEFVDLTVLDSIP